MCRGGGTGPADPASARPKIQSLFLKIIINPKPTINSNLVAISA